MNLITNAYHAVESSGGKIFLSLHQQRMTGEDLPGINIRKGQHAVLSVKDNGPGIAPEVLPKIFDPYFTTKKQGKGTGLGLAVVYGIVRGHQGDIAVSSKLEKGSEFSIYLPISEKNLSDTEENAISALPGGTERILLLDDEIAVINLQKQMLSRLGYQITISTDPCDAIREIQSHPEDFDLIISDMTMPGMTGDVVAKKISSKYPEIPIIICTGFSEKINEEKIHELSIKKIVMKPIKKATIAHTVRQVLDEVKSHKKKLLP